MVVGVYSESNDSINDRSMYLYYMGNHRGLQQSLKDTVMIQYLYHPGK